MNLQINQLVKSLLQKETLEQCSLQELEQFADRHPYFGAAQLLLTKKLQLENPERYDEQLQKTFLFFNNPLWVQHLLNETGNAEIIVSEKKQEPVLQPIVNEPVAIATVPEIHNNKEEFTNPALTAEPTIETVTEKQEPEIVLPALKIEAIDPATAELTFEPFHTVDYFASQGIKFKEEEKPVDKFGQQLKSFTDWLKAMKRLPVTEITKTVEASSEKKVAQLAEHSITEREVVTETMAEVWEKQGNAVKAIEIYGKLSLLEPSKSPYFAAKIEELKKTI
ncbi:MAG: hypothetical protein IPF69_10240 [Chitinophagaceae bacterium]|jgi:hypothetical protein|nr:hypothetical protein [Chitinophagaceae bacterium]MBK9463337.1 hypothetical protein [Chitinophagaceae bacterium]MBK9659535.1 hypothetical protein [Chitinophagaceae bacterium]